MIRGTTPTLTFNLPFETSLLKSAYITVKSQNVEIEKTIDDCELTENSIATTLSQEETLQLPKDYRVKVQLRVLTKDGKALATDVYIVELKTILKEGVIE